MHVTWLVSVSDVLYCWFHSVTMHITAALHWSFHSLLWGEFRCFLPTWPMSALILNHHVASVLLGKQIEASVVRAVWTLWVPINPLPLSFSPPLCFSLLPRPVHIVMEVMCGQALRMDNQAAALHTTITLQLISLSLSLCRLCKVQQYDPAHSHLHVWAVRLNAYFFQYNFQFIRCHWS